MNFQKITKFDTSNGPGIRTVLWVSGCNHHCKNCHNPDTWDATSGVPFDEGTLKEVLDSLAPSYIEGLTLSGGDPMYPENRSTIEYVVSSVKKVYPEKSIWMYTGYDYENISDSPILDYVDVLVDGPYLDKLRDLTLPYCGSKNQRVIDLKATRSRGTVISYV